MPRTVVLIHGAWLNSACWEGFRARYEARGHIVHAPDWPYDDRPPVELRTRPAPELAKVGQRDIIAHYKRFIRSLPEAPILIGHSAGGVFVQHLLDRGVGVAGVAIDPAPTPGVPLYPHAIVSALPVFLDPFSGRKLKQMSRRFFQRRFAQLVSEGPGRRALRSLHRAHSRQGLLGRCHQQDRHQLVQSRPATTVADRRWQGPHCRRGDDGRHLPQAVASAERHGIEDLSGSIALDLPRSGWEEVADYALDLGRAARDGECAGRCCLTNHGGITVEGVQTDADDHHPRRDGDFLQGLGPEGRPADRLPSWLAAQRRRLGQPDDVLPRQGLSGDRP